MTTMKNIPQQYADLVNSTMKVLKTYIESEDFLKEVRNSVISYLSSDVKNRASHDGFPKFEAAVKDVSVEFKETAESIRDAADYLDEVWKDCKIAHASGTSAGIVGGLLTIGGGIATILTAGAAAPFLISGIVTAVAGSFTSIGAKITEVAINSTEVKKAEEKLGKAASARSNLKTEINKIFEGKEGAKLLGEVIGAITCAGICQPWLLELLANCIVGGLGLAPGIGKVAAGAISTAGKAYGEAVKKASTQAVKQVAEEGASETVQTGAKAASKAGAKIAGSAIIGVSAIFVVWDAVDLGFTIKDIVKDKGSEAAKILREMADELDPKN